VSTTWRKELQQARASAGDQSEIVAVSPGETVLDVSFDDGYGGAEGPAVLIWSEERVYFPMTYDGSEWLDSAPRNPQPDGQAHVGGE
jgi:hypothetical protein